ncbi:MAG: peptidoglycan-associated lipoprotein Pal [Campylobacteraceae bacterium]
MKKLVLVFVTSFIGLFLLTGCPQKTPSIDVTTKDTGASSTVADSGVSGIGGIDKESVSSEELASRLAKLIAQIEQNSQKIYFDFDQFSIRPDMQAVIAENAKLFNLVDAQALTIKVEGNCDEWGTDEYNYALGLKRAKSVKDALIAQGVSENRVTIVSYGESNPTCTSQTKECWDKNRRAEFKLLP